MLLTRCVVRNSFLLRRIRSYIVSMKIGDTIEYTNLDGDVTYGIVCEGLHKHTFDTTAGAKYHDAVKVAWMDDASVTTELVDDILNPEYEGIVLVA